MAGGFQRWIRSFFSPKTALHEYLFNLLGFKPGKIFFYELALTHRSASNLDLAGKAINNERLEFLGDAILDAIVSDFLYHEFPEADEGFMTQLRAKLVNGDFLGELAQKIGLAQRIKAYTNTLNVRKHFYGDALEALIGAIYLDKGYAVANNFVINRLLLKNVNLSLLIRTDTNFKSQLIEWAQKMKQDISFQTEPDPSEPRTFLSQVYQRQQIIGVGRGMSKKLAEQMAARHALDNLEPESGIVFDRNIEDETNSDKKEV